jgi:glycogen operon protein
MFNASAEPAAFRVPPAPNGVQWRVAADTSHESPEDIFPAGEEPVFDSTKSYPMTPRSSAVLLWRRSRIAHD